MTVQPPTARGRARRLDVLDAARRVFARTSYFDVRVADVAAEAGVSHGTFYTYFPSKDAVLRALVDELVDDLYAAATTHPDGDPLTGTIQAFMDAYRERASLLRVLEQVVTVSPEFLEVRLGIKQRFTRRIETALATAQARGQADPDLDVHHTAYALGGMVESMAYACYVLRQPELDERVLVATMSRLWRGGISAPAPSGG